MAVNPPDWVLGFADQVQGSCLARPELHASAADKHLHVEQVRVGRDEPDLSCYRLIRTDTHQMLLRFVDGQPVSQVTEGFLAWANWPRRAKRRSWSWTSPVGTSAGGCGPGSR